MERMPFRKKLDDTRQKRSWFLRARGKGTGRKINWREWEDLYLSLTAEALFGYYVLQDGRFCFVNPKLAEIFGYSVEEMLEDVEPLNLAHPDDRSMVEEHIANRLEGRARTSTYTFRGRRRDGATIYIQIIGSFTYYRGRPAVHGNMLDVTEQWRAEKKVKSSEALYRNITENMLDMINQIDEQGCFIYASPSHRHIIGYEPEEIIGRKCLELVHPEDLEAGKAYIQACRRERKPGHLEFRVQHKNGHYIWVEMVGKFLFNEEGRFSGAILAVRDIGKRKKAQEALQDSESRLRLVMDNMIDMIGRLDHNGQYTFVGHSHRVILGYDYNELLGRSMFDFIHPADRGQALGKFEISRISGVLERLEFRFLRSDGNYVWLESTGSSIHDREGQFAGLVMGSREITERKRAEKALSESEMNLRHQVDYLNTLINNMNELFFTYDREGCLTFVNKKCVDIMGWNPEDKIGKPVLELALEADWPRITKEMRDRLENGGPSRYELPVLSPNGRKLLRLNSSPIIENGAVTGGMVLAEDITEGREQEIALRESENNLRSRVEHLNRLIHNMNEIFATCDPEFRITLINKKATEVLGYQQEELLGKSILTLVPEDDREEARRRMARGLSRGEAVSYEHPVMHKNGNVIFLRINYSPIMENGTKTGGMLLAEDFTERLAMEEALAAEKERLAVTLRSIGDGVITTDLRGKITLMNEVAERLTGWTQEEVRGRYLGQVLRIANARTGIVCYRPSQMIFKINSAVELQRHTLIRRDGSERLIDMTGAPIRDEKDSFRGVVSVFRDVTERDRMESEILKVNKLESLGVLAGGLAHDFNNLLTIIMGNISMGRLKAAVGGMPDHLLEAEKAIMRAKGLTQQLLTFAEGGAPIKKAASIAELVMESISFAVAGRHVKVKFDLAADLWPAEVDEGQFNQVLNNLILNAVQAMPASGVITVAGRNITASELSLVPRAESKPGEGWIKITVTDQGTGISAENQARIFDPFFTTKSEGVGLGLTTAYSIIRNHGGYIEVQSRLGVGTTFSIYLPASPAAVAMESQEGSGLVAGKGRILLMDDELQICEVVSEMIAAMGYQIDVACDGREALKMYQTARFRGEPYGAVIMDLTVPGGMGGKEAINLLLAIDPSARAVVSSGYSSDPIMADYRSWGFKGVIAKPYGMRELGEVLKQVLEEEVRREV